jgi:glycosyltransferase involved in cell wall biosynthesis
MEAAKRLLYLPVGGESLRSSPRLSIALLHYSAPPIVGGVESVLAHHARLMAAAGHVVRILAGRGDQASLPVPFVSKPLLDSRDPRVEALKIELDAGRAPPDLEPLTSELEASLAEELDGVDLLIAHNVCSLHKNLALTAALHRLHRSGRLRRLILWHHDLAWTSPRYRPEMHAGYPWDLLRTDWGAEHVAVSRARQAELAALMKIPPERITVVPNGIDAAGLLKLEPVSLDLIHRLHLDEADPLLLLPVRITPRKNIELALRVLADLRRTFPHAALVVTGPPGPHNPANRHYFEQLLALRAELNLEAKAHFLAEIQDGYVPDAVIADLYQIADLLFLPSREEGFGIPLLEAAFHRVPVFCADIPVLRELGGREATYFALDSTPASIAALIADWLKHNPDHAFRARAWREATWEAVYRQSIAPVIER